MAAAATEPAQHQFDTVPMSEQHSHVLGAMTLYAPAAPPSEWGNLPWRITTEKGWEPGEPGLDYRIKAAHAQEAWRHIALVQYRPEWHA